MGDINEVFAYPHNLWFHHSHSLDHILCIGVRFGRSYVDTAHRAFFACVDPFCRGIVCSIPGSYTISLSCACLSSLPTMPRPTADRDTDQELCHAWSGMVLVQSQQDRFHCVAGSHGFFMGLEAVAEGPRLVVKR